MGTRMSLLLMAIQVPCETADVDTTIRALTNWFAAFGTAPQWVSDRGPHFKNEVVRGLREATRGFHYFTYAYCPWTNGTVEFVYRELLRVMRALVSES